MKTSNYCSFEAILNNHWLKSHVEGHLILSLLVRGNYWLRLCLSTLFSLIMICVYYYSINFEVTNSVVLLYLVYITIFFNVSALVANYAVAALLWVSVKLGLFLFSIGITITGAAYYLSGKENSIYLIAMGLFLLPSFEFVPRLQKYQKIISIICLCGVLLCIKQINET